MKRNYLALSVLGLALLGASCTKELEQGKTENEYTGKTIQVEFSLSEQETKGFTDEQGLVWEVGDQVKFSEGGVSEPLTADQITENGHKASFTFPASLIEEDRTGWFKSMKNHPSNNNEIEFTLGKDGGNVYSQAVAGVMNSRYSFLHSGTGLVSISKDVVPSVQMEIPGSIFRVIPYTTSFNAESIISVKLQANGGIVGTVAYDYGGGTYRGVNDINWKKYNFVQVNLDTPFSLEGVTSDAQSKGIYMAVAKTNTEISGYSYIVETNKAIYEFASTNKFVVENNKVKNVFLNLDKGTRTVQPSGSLKYVGSIGDTYSSQISADGITNLVLGSWYAQIKEDGSTEWVTKEGSGNEDFYRNVEFKAYDPDTNAPIDWVSVNYPDAGGTQWLLTAQANTATTERTAKIVATFPDVKGFTVVDECKTKTLLVTQAATGAKKVVEIASRSLPSSKEISGSKLDKQDIGYCLLKVDGVDNRVWSSAGIYARSRFVAVSEEDYNAKNYTNPITWLSCEYANNGTNITDCIWLLSAEENTTGAPRTAYMVCLFPEDDNYLFPEPVAVKVTQKAYVDPGVIPADLITYDLEIVNKNGFGFSPNKTGDQGNWAFIRNPKLNENPVVITQALAEELVAKAFKSVAPTDEEKAKYNMSAKTASAEAVVTKVRWFGGVQIDVTLNTGAGGCITKIIAYNADGTEFGSMMVWTD